VWKCCSRKKTGAAVKESAVVHSGGVRLRKEAGGGRREAKVKVEVKVENGE
jgi:hypothetical protein